MDTINIYFEIAKKHFLSQWQYRSNFVLRMIGELLSFFVMINVWQALYRARGEVGGVNLQQMIVYTLVAGVLSRLGGTGIAYSIGAMVKDGSIGNELVKPADFKYMQVAREAGAGLLEILVFTIPAALVMALIYGFSLDANAFQVVLFLISALLGRLMCYWLYFLFGVIAFWTKTAEYAQFLISGLLSIFGGSIVPLWFYPAGLQAVALALPFRYLTFEPLAILLGQRSELAALQAIAVQAGWLLAFIVLEKWLWGRVQKHLVIQGG